MSSYQLKLKNNIINLIGDSIFTPLMAGVCISIGCIVNLQVGCGIIGAIMFSFGLIAVVHYQYTLFTGSSGFIRNVSDFIALIIILAFNILGCFITSKISCYAIGDMTDKCNQLMTLRDGITNGQAFIRAMFCGILMTTAVKFARENKYLPLLFAVPVFILSGFYHSIADAFYGISSDIHLTYSYWMVVLGNFVGCNIPRLFRW